MKFMSTPRFLDIYSGFLTAIFAVTILGGFAALATLASMWAPRRMAVRRNSRLSFRIDFLWDAELFGIDWEKLATVSKRLSCSDRISLKPSALRPAAYRLPHKRSGKMCRMLVGNFFECHATQPFIVPFVGY
jgi:hypothetical protein